MKRFKQVETRLLLFLILGILLLSIGFVSCGTGPQTKTTVPDKGAYAVDFSAAPSELGFIDLSKSINSMAGLTEFTIEAWIKPNTTTLNGGVFSRSTGSEGGGDLVGIALYIENSKPHFKITSGGDVVTTSLGTVLTNNQWAHIAVVLVNQNHDGVHNDCDTDDNGTPNADPTAPHVDIYKTGEGGTLTFIDCALATYPVGEFSFSERIGRLHSQFGSMEINTRLDAVIDEVRFWKVARTNSQIQTWMNKEITETNRNQADPDNQLIGCWSLNEGAGSTIVDSSGTGNGGVKNYCNSDCLNGGNSILWDGGWTTGKPF